MPSMSSVVAKPGQTWMDIAIEHLGSAEAAFELAALNGMAFTSPLQAGRLVDLPGVRDKQVVRDYTRRPQSPAANLDDDLRDGIGYWTIGTDFIVQ